MKADTKKPTEVRVLFLPIDELTPNPQNARVHDAAQVDQIAKSIREFGFTNPILVDRTDDNLIVAGHGRRLALLDLMDGGFDIALPGGAPVPPGSVPVIDCSGWTEGQRRAYTLADNAIAENATWDEDLLSLELGDLSDDAEVSLDLIGFGPEMIQSALANRPERGGFLDDLAGKAPPEEVDGGATPGARKSSSGVALTFTVAPKERDEIIDWLNTLKKEYGVATAAAALARFAHDQKGNHA